MIVLCKFMDAEGNPRGRDYSYETDEIYKVGDVVRVPKAVKSSDEPETETEVVVCKTDVDPEEIEYKGPFKKILGKSAQTVI